MEINLNLYSQVYKKQEVEEEQRKTLETERRKISKYEREAKKSNDLSLLHFHLHSIKLIHLI